MARPKKIRTAGVYSEDNGTYYLKYKNKTYRGFRTVEEAEIYKATLRLNNETIESVKFSEVIADFILDQKARLDAEEITYGTYDKKLSALKHYITDELGKYRLNKLTPRVLRKFRNDLISVEISSVHKNYILQLLKSVLDYARKYHELKDDLSIYVERLPKTASEKRKDKNRLNYIWTNEDFEKFTNGMELNYLIVFVLMFKHGLRMGEAQALRYCDVDFENKTIDINGSITRKTKESTFERKTTKTFDSTRVIFVGGTIKIIEELMIINSRKYKFNDRWYICDNKQPLTDKKIQRKRESHISKAELPKCTNHDMRHMFVTNAWSNGIPITAISKYIGHKNVSITLNTYSHLTQADDDKMSEYIENN